VGAGNSLESHHFERGSAEGSGGRSYQSTEEKHYFWGHEMPLVNFSSKAMTSKEKCMLTFYKNGRRVEEFRGEPKIGTINN